MKSDVTNNPELKYSSILHQFFVLSIITLLGLLLRIYHLAYKPLWLDEAVIYWISNRPIADVVAENATRNSAPPLYPLLIKLITLIGNSEGVLRSVSLLAGVLSIPAIYFLSRKVLLSPRLISCRPTRGCGGDASAVLTGIARVLPDIPYRHFGAYCIYRVYGEPNLAQNSISRPLIHLGGLYAIWAGAAAV